MLVNKKISINPSKNFCLWSRSAGTDSQQLQMDTSQLILVVLSSFTPAEVWASVFYNSTLLKHSTLWATRTVWRNVCCQQSMWSPLHALVLFCHSILTLICVCRCESCGAVFHSECKVKAVPCPRCVRKELQKKQKSFWRRLNMDENFEESCNMFELSYQNTWVP